jgi:DNA-binding beta-propeller fold protein YncE
MRKRLVFCLILLLLAGISQIPRTARADGGAPNLAYVSGSNEGISVVDVSLRKVNQTIAAEGRPNMILLSIDARFLYVTQPQLNQVSIIAAKTGETICKASVPGQPELLALDKNSGTIYAAGNGASTVSAIDPTNCQIKHTYQASSNVHGLGIASVGGSDVENRNQLWVAEENAVTVFNADNEAKLASIPVPEGPEYVSIPPGTSVYVTTRQGSVLGINFTKREPVVLYKGSHLGPMDYNEISGDIYVPDKDNKQLVVLAPMVNGSSVASGPKRQIALEAAPESIAITSDGLLGFAALADGKVAMLDIPGRTVVEMIDVGGQPRFIITGMYPPVIGTTPQEANTYTTLANIAAYAFVAVLLLLPVLLLWRYNREQARKKKLAQERAAQEGSSVPALEEEAPLTSRPSPQEQGEAQADTNIVPPSENTEEQADTDVSPPQEKL